MKHIDFSVPDFVKHFTQIELTELGFGNAHGLSARGRDPLHGFF